MGNGFSRYKKEIQKQHGFTIVELIIVIVVIGILVAVAIVGYGSWKQNTQANQIKSDLGQAVTAMESARNNGTGYPSSVPSTLFTPSSGVTVTVSNDSTTTAFCLDGSIVGNSTTFYIDSTVSIKQISQGSCATRPVAPPVPTGLAAASSTTTTINFTWTVSSGATSYNGQCATNSTYTTGVVSGVVGALGSSTSGSLTGLSPVTPYYCHINAASSNGTSAYTSSITPSTVVGAPVVTQTASSSYFNLSWTSVSSATSYQMQYTTDSTFSTGLNNVNMGTSLSTLYNPGSKATYYVRVRANGPTGYGAYSNVATCVITLLAP